MEQQLTQENNKSTEASSNVVLTPGKMRVIKRNGKVVSFEEEKIKIMDDFINKNKSQFKDENLKFSSKLKK